MKYNFTQLMNIVTGRRFIIIVCMIALCVGAYLILSRNSSKHFTTAYSAYAELAKEQGEAAYLPAAPNNPVRQQLNLALAEALQSNVSPSKRLSDAAQGLNLLAQLEEQVDAIGDTSDAANAALAKLQVVFADDLTLFAAAREIISLAKKRSADIEDIRGLSYRADFGTRKIFERIIADKGVLTKAHINDLNSEIPDLETQFDRRTNLYSDMQSMSARIDDAVAALGFGDSVPQLSH